MPFSFLHLWFWLGAFAVAAPIYLHLRRKQEKNLIRFSAVRFLEDQPAPRRSPLELRHLWLLALRALALLLIIAAFAWPYVRGANTAPIRESRVYILDNTLSRQANDGFQRDRDQVINEVRRAGLDLQVAVVELTAMPRVVTAFGDTRQTALEKLRELQPSFQRGPYLAAFRQANSLLANSLGDRKRIVFLGDNQENQWTENVNTPPFLRNVEVDLPKPGPAALPNLGLSEPRVQRIFLGDKSLVNFTVKLSHQGEGRTANILLRANGQLVFNRAVNLEQQPETILLQGQWEAEPAAWLRGQVTVEGTPDELAGDNHVYFALPPVVEGKVAVLAQSPYVRLALSPDIMRGEWDARFLDPAKLGAELAGNRDADVLVAESSYLQSVDARKLLWRYLTNGRGVLLVVNRVAPTVAGCLRELGFEIQGSVHRERESPEKFQFVFSNHPIFHPFLSPDYGNLMDIRVSDYVRLKPGDALPLIVSENGNGLFFQSTRMPGKLFVIPFGLDREHTSWPVHQTFIPFLDLALQAARAEDPTPTAFEPGELGRVLLPAGAPAREVVLRDGPREIGRGWVDQGRAQLRMPDQPGLYALTHDDGDKVERVFSVNPSAKESQLAYVGTPEVLKTWQLNRPAEARKAGVARTEMRLAAILQQRFWWWMVWGGLAALMLEMGLAEARKE